MELHAEHPVARPKPHSRGTAWTTATAEARPLGWLFAVQLKGNPPATPPPRASRATTDGRHTTTADYNPRSGWRDPVVEVALADQARFFEPVGVEQDPTVW